MCPPSPRKCRNPELAPKALSSLSLGWGPDRKPGTLRREIYPGTLSESVLGSMRHIFANSTNTAPRTRSRCRSHCVWLLANDIRTPRAPNRILRSGRGSLRVGGWCRRIQARLGKEQFRRDQARRLSKADVPRRLYTCTPFLEVPLTSSRVLFGALRWRGLSSRGIKEQPHDFGSSAAIGKRGGCFGGTANTRVCGSSTAAPAGHLAARGGPRAPGQDILRTAGRGHSRATSVFA